MYVLWPRLVLVWVGQTISALKKAIISNEEFVMVKKTVLYELRLKKEWVSSMIVKTEYRLLRDICFNSPRLRYIDDDPW